MNGAQWVTVAGDLIGIGSLVFTCIISARTKRTLRDAYQCPVCGGINSGYLHEAGCPGPLR